jgi:hypothetical protein
MSRPQKVHKPIKGAFNNILASIGVGTGKAKQAATKAQHKPAKSHEPPRAQKK